MTVALPACERRVFLPIGFDASYSAVGGRVHVAHDAVFASRRERITEPISGLIDARIT